MMEPIKLTTPVSREFACSLEAGTPVSIDGELLALRDRAHSCLIEILRAGERPPFELDGALILYASPTPAKPGKIIGSIGPTTSLRMDPFTPELLAAGVRGTIGKGPRGGSVVEAMIEHGAVYLAVTGGIAALLAKKVISCKTVAFEQLGPEAALRLEVRDFPAIVAQDCRGGNLYKMDHKSINKPQED